MRVKVLALALIILAVSIFKVAFPNSFSIAREKLQPVSDFGESIAEGFLNIGKRLSGNEDRVYTFEGENAASDAFPEETEPAEKASQIIPEGFDLDEMVSFNLMGLIETGASEFFPPESEDPHSSENVFPLGQEPEPVIDEEALALEALSLKLDDFLTRQAAVTDIALPESVWAEAVLIDFEYVKPVPLDYTSAFGYRLHPIYNDVRFHYGTDFPAFSGDSIGAFAGGTVIAAQEFDGYGQTIIIEHENGFTSLYAHCSKLMVSYGDKVTMGQTIALVGATGNVTGPHLHFELQKDGKYLNPEFYL